MRDEGKGMREKGREIPPFDINFNFDSNGQ